MYEGDTEKLYIEKLLTTSSFKKIANQYIAFVHVGGAYSHWYRELIHFLGIKTLIITDIDYTKKLVDIDEIKMDTGITNEGLLEYYRDYAACRIMEDDVVSYCEKACEEKQENCFYTKRLLEQINFFRNNSGESPCPQLPEINTDKINKKPKVSEVMEWQNQVNTSLIKVVSQGEKDGYTRTLEESMLCKLFGIAVDDRKNRTWWKEQRKNLKIKISIPNPSEEDNIGDELNVRDIINSTEGNKTDFMYSIILAELHLKSLPHYIEEGLKWLEN